MSEGSTQLSRRWLNRPLNSNWGDFGPDDQNGCLNLIGPKQVLQAMAEVTVGLTFCLSLPLDFPGGSVLNPRRRPPALYATTRNGKPNINYRMGQDDGWQSTDVMCDDYAILYTQYSTQWDSFAHVGGMFDADGDGTPEACFYNGYKAGVDVIGPDDKAPLNPEEGNSYAHALGIEKMAERCVQGRGVLVDFYAHYGLKHRPVGYDDLMRLMEQDNVVVESGDMLVIRTGLDRIILDMKKSPEAHVLHNSCAGLNGRDSRLLQWITDSGLSVIVSDNIGVEYEPNPTDQVPYARAPLHEYCLFKNGIHLGELWLLSPLAEWLREHKRSRFLLTAPPLRLPGSIGSPATPVATV